MVQWQRRAFACVVGGAAGVLAMWPLAALAQRGETVRIAWIDSLSGPFANVGNNIVRTFRFLAERARDNPAGVTFEVVPFDSKGSPQESLTVLKTAADQGIRYIAQGQSSAIAGALVDAIDKHNARHPGQEIVLLNYAAVDPALTNERCSFWHFRFDADTSMKMEAMTTFMKDDASVRKVYLINQNYAHGQQVSRLARETLARKRPDVQVVGDDLHPIGLVKDFAPYVAKMKAAGADTVITGNWGNDLALLIKAAKDAGLSANFYTYYANAAGTPTVIGDALAGKVKIVYVAYPGLAGAHAQVQRDFRARFGEDYTVAAVYHLFALLPAAMVKAQSTDPVRVARALEDLSVASYSGDVKMRKADHQLQLPLYLASWQPVGAGAGTVNVENTGYTWALERRFDAYQSSTPTSCQMVRPAG